LRDEAGQSIDADPRSAELLDAHQAGSLLKRTDPTFQGWVSRQGRWRWQNTPATCQELSLSLSLSLGGGDKVIIYG